SSWLLPLLPERPPSSPTTITCWRSTRTALSASYGLRSSCACGGSHELIALATARQQILALSGGDAPVPPVCPAPCRRAPPRLLLGHSLRSIRAETELDNGTGSRAAY